MTSLVVDEVIELWIQRDGNLFQYACVSGCLAWYEKGLELCYEIAQVISEHVPITRFGWGKVLFPFDDKHSFAEKAHQQFDSKYKKFISKYSVKDVKLLPNREFFEYYRGRTQKSLLLWCKWKLKRLLKRYP